MRKVSPVTDPDVTSPPHGSALAAAFSPRTLKTLSQATLPAHDLRRLRAVVDLVEPDNTLAQAFDVAYATLRRTYRSEYLYKNHLVSNVVFGRRSPHTSSAIPELPMGRSCADLLVLNGTSTTYEIKTDLDQLSRLDQQLSDYRTRSEYVYVVVSDTRAATVESLLPPWVGVLALTQRGRLSQRRVAESNLERLVPDHLHQLLRTHEAVQVLSETTGYELDVPAGHAWKRTRALFNDLPIPISHPAVVRQLKLRGRGAAEMATRAGFPFSMRALAYTAELSSVGRDRVHQRLAMRVAAI